MQRQTKCLTSYKNMFKIYMRSPCRGRLSSGSIAAFLRLRISVAVSSPPSYSMPRFADQVRVLGRSDGEVRRVHGAEAARLVGLRQAERLDKRTIRLHSLECEPIKPSHSAGNAFDRSGHKYTYRQQCGDHKVTAFKHIDVRDRHLFIMSQLDCAHPNCLREIL